MSRKNGKAVSRVLIADDDPVIRHWITSILEAEGYGVVSMNDGRDAYRFLQGDANFAGAVFDMTMPHLDGADLIRHMRTEKRLMRIPVMLITAETDIKLVASGFAAGATILLPKPFTRNRLQQMLRMMLGAQAVSEPTSPTTSLPTLRRKALNSWSEEKRGIASLTSASTAEREHREAGPSAEGPVNVSLLLNLEDNDGSVDENLVVELIELYLENGSRQVNEIKTAAGNMREETLKHTAHALKGSSLTMGASRVGQLCAELEQENIRNSDSIGKLMQKLETAFELTGEIFNAERRKRLTPVAA